MKEEVLWLVIEPKDPLELPLFSGTVKEVAELRRCTVNSVESLYSKYKTGKLKTCPYRRVVVDNAETV